MGRHKSKKNASYARTGPNSILVKAPALLENGSLRIIIDNAGRTGLSQPSCSGLELSEKEHSGIADFRKNASPHGTAQDTLLNNAVR